MPFSWLRGLVDGVVQLVYPGCCHLCGQHVPDIRHVFCQECRTALLTDPWTICPHCAATIGQFAKSEGGCIQCRKENFPFDTALRLGPYEGRLRELILQIKRPRGQFLAEVIAELWFERDRSRFESLGIDAVVPIPSHWRRRWWTGCHPVGTLARRLARQLHLPFQPRWLFRTKWIVSQIGLSSTAARRDNVRNAFQVKRDLQLKHQTILLIDDVMTTGSTAREAAAPLRRAGAKRVIVAALARRSWETPHLS
jgi:ComF family protein